MDPATTNDTTLVVTKPPTEPTLASVPALLLEDRVHRLEETVAALSQLQGWDDSPQVNEKPFVRPILQGSETQRAIPIPPPPTASLAEFTLPPMAQAANVRPLSSLLQPVQAALPVASTVAKRVLSASSLWRDLWWDVRTGWRMIRDPAYPMTTACKVVPAFAVFYVTIWPWLSSWSGVIGTVMNYFVNAVVIYIAFKVVQRELRRYYEFAEKYRR